MDDGQNMGEVVAKTESAWFERGVSVHRRGNPADVLGVELDDSMLAMLAGAFSNAVVHVDVAPEGLSFSVTHPEWIETQSQNLVSFGYRNGKLVLELHRIDLSEAAPEGLAAVMLLRMVRTCQDLKADYITLFAAGGRTAWLEEGRPRYWGYYAWPRFGFNFGLRSHAEYAGHMRFLDEEFLYYPVGVTDCEDVLSLMSRPGGDKLWCMAGFQATMDFELAPKSDSVQTLANYLKQKGFL
jgi:hypothetical protein